MKHIKIIVASLMTAFTLLNPFTSLAAGNLNIENCGAYLFEWRPVDCGDGQAFAILVGGSTLYEGDVILRKGYDYAYTVDPGKYPRPWGPVPALVNIDGVWGIPENWDSMPEGSQPTSRIVLYTNNKNMDAKERFIYVVHLPGGVDASSLPDSVRKYLINVDGSDAGAYDGTITSGWYKDEKGWKFRQLDGSFVTDSWVTVNGEAYFMGDDGILLSDTITPDGFYVNSEGIKQTYMPGWVEADGQWKYIQKNGYYAAATWVQDTDGKYYYFNMATRMLMNEMTPDGYYVDANGVWDGQPSTIKNEVNLGPGTSDRDAANSEEGWEEVDGSWKYRLTDGNYVINAWKQDADGKWYYFNESALMVTNTTTPDGYYVGSDGVWTE